MSPKNSSSASTNIARKRVDRACNRCRSKKTKCDSGKPCCRCRADNAICILGARKKAHDKVYPKGYVKMLEQQHIWLVAGLRQLYRRALNGQGWPSGLLRCQANGHPLTHDLLTCLGVLDHSKGEGFEVDALDMYHELCKQDAPASAQHQECSELQP
ncbi:Zn(II)2Cys6 transcription factor [Aspergillus lentulus]|nr:Zn(II)2Cys6 transcription factor [Aspergillus lentulus]